MHIHGAIIPAALKQVFPQAEGGISDWREFNETSERITVSPFPDTPIEFSKDLVKTEGKYTTWIGRNASLPGSSLVTVATSNGYDAILIVPGSTQFSYHVNRDGSLVTTEAEPGTEGCGNFPVQLNRRVARASALLPVAIRYGSADTNQAAVTTAADILAPGKTDNIATVLAVADATALTVDVLVLYDADTLAVASKSAVDGAGYIDGQSKAMLESGNVVLAQSGVTSFVWRYVGSLAAPAFTRTAQLSDDLAALTPGGELGAWVQAQRITCGADQIFFWRGQPVPGIAGQAYSNSLPQAPVEVANAVAAGIWGSSYKVMIHELGHGFGCQHDRGNSGPNQAGVPDGDGNYCYAELWSQSWSWTNGPVTASTIMGYGSAVIPYYSNPGISIDVNYTFGNSSFNYDWGTQALGRSAADPRAAYNAKILQDNAAAMSVLVAEITFPQIITQPTGAAVRTGGALDLVVAARGANLAYQWSKDHAVIAGATAATYSKSSAASADAGAYTVVVSNVLGAVTSTAAAVTVITLPAALTPAPLSSSSGGGGGAIRPLFLAALALLGLARWFVRR